MKPRVLSFAAALLFALPSVAVAGPCQPLIDQTQAAVDKFIDSIAGKGPTAPESTNALLSHEPTPGAIAQVEGSLGEGKRPEAALAAMERARKADAAGDTAACQNALAQARKAIGS